jgi:FtsP/CotA-like multicopper oxidase with cupredoxin domain
MAGDGRKQQQRRSEYGGKEQHALVTGRHWAQEYKARLPYFAAAMSNKQRIALIVAAVVVAVVAFVIAWPGSDDESERAATTTSTQTDTGDDSAEPQPTTDAEPPPPPEPEVARINIKGGAVAGGAKNIEVAKGDTVRIVVTADAPDEIHLHGYDITRNAAPGQPARFRFKANAEGAFEIESHVAEDAGLDALVARLVVSPS